MYRILLALFLLSIYSCDDGDFEIPSFDFNDTVNSCGTYVVYRTNSSQTEALILRLTDQEILPEETLLSPRELSITTENIQDRLFNGEITNNYFCADVPPTEPIVTRNWTGVQGSDNFLSIETTAVLDDNLEILGYEHSITIHNLILESNGESMTFETYEFGSFTINL